MNNIDWFNVVVAKTVLRLYSNFPVPVDLDPGEIANDATHESETETLTNENVHERYEAVGETLKFLQIEGFITLGSHDLMEDRFSGCRLTLKGLTLLGTLPASVKAPQKTLAQEIRDAVNGGAVQTISTAVNQLFTRAFATGWGAMLAP